MKIQSQSPGLWVCLPIRPQQSAWVADWISAPLHPLNLVVYFFFFYVYFFDDPLRTRLQIIINIVLAESQTAGYKDLVLTEVAIL